MGANSFCHAFAPLATRLRPPIRPDAITPPVTSSPIRSLPRPYGLSPHHALPPPPRHIRAHRPSILPVPLPRQPARQALPPLSAALPSASRQQCKARVGLAEGGRERLGVGRAGYDAGCLGGGGLGGVERVEGGARSAETGEEGERAQGAMTRSDGPDGSKDGVRTDALLAKNDNDMTLASAILRSHHRERARVGPRPNHDRRPQVPAPRARASTARAATANTDAGLSGSSPDAGVGMAYGGGMGVVYRKLDSLIGEAARRTKGE